MILSLIALLLLTTVEPARRKSRRKKTRTSDEENARMLADILKFINDEPPSIKDPIEGCPPHDTNCPMGYMCNIVRSRTCANGECILNKSQVCELDCQLALCNAEDQKIQENRNLFHMAGGRTRVPQNLQACGRKTRQYGINLSG